MGDDEIERVARAIVAGIGLNPEAITGCSSYADETPAERHGRIGDADTWIEPGIGRYVPLWRLYRWKAAEAIATKNAL